MIWNIGLVVVDVWVEIALEINFGSKLAGCEQVLSDF